ncbi:hypothetical protein [Brevibacillus choshinensis]|uniref:hypothetical protein n=1 Tax=Brevibacillus choshinensis TaxID=54911 RepID=UPI002E1F2041|nr:hypothetical protein [Brevibacillus choshinensis]
MRIMLNNEIIFEGKDISKITDIFDSAYKMIIDKGQVYSHITVDGLDIYENPIESLTASEATVDSVEIKAISLEQFKVDILCSIQEYVSRSISELNRLSEEFYINPDDKAWNEVSQLLEGIQWIEKASMFLSANDTSAEYDHILEKCNVQAEMKLLETAVFQNDLVLVGDILKYEIYPRFTDIDHAVGQVLKPNNEVENDVVN